MTLRRGRAWIIGTMIATLLVPVASTAGPRDELERLRREREQLHAKIEANTAEADSLEARAKNLNAEMIEYRKSLAALDADIARIESEVRTAQARIDATETEIAKVEKVAQDQATALYKSGSTEILDALLNSRTLADLDSRLEFLGVAAQENTGALVDYHRLKLEVESQHAILFAKKHDLEAVRNEQARIYARLDERHDELKETLAALEEKLGHQHAKEGNLLVAEAEIVGDIQAAQAVRSSLSRGISREGFIWPLNNAITSYYGYRWGRMHNGIDIDGTTGEPIVAAKEGTVIMAQPYSGYGNAVVIDHGGGVATLYAHLSSFEVRSGASVSQGQIVGAVGCTGSCTGDHLHFEVRVNGSPRDPLDFLP